MVNNRRLGRVIIACSLLVFCAGVLPLCAQITAATIYTYFSSHPTSQSGRWLDPDAI